MMAVHVMLHEFSQIFTYQEKPQLGGTYLLEGKP